MSSSEEQHVYHPKVAISTAAKTTLITGSMATMGGAYEFVKTASANLREKEDFWNATLGGFFAGAAMGFRARTFPAVLGYGATVATVLGVFEYTGGRLEGYGTETNVDEYDRRESLRKNYRSPGEQTIAELGEGRGTYLLPLFGDPRVRPF
ncbi:NADH:ubiquinone oxidoreductase subunit [Coccidioides immitis RMSCC 3703]|uniref:NADH:ubiquinone oxidoreductase subunit n=1 Tax=Coccidioides immitis RMSCC 3703 TaxID=454286 RepID=A0A0J8QUS7_COCIT|nr:NADH:ubiquinone oxidoreductase subunit [Coccidioides immitis RMSCC 3703]